MHLGTKSYLKSNRNHTAKHTLSDGGHANLQGVQLFLEVGIMMNTFIIFHVSLLKSGVVNSAYLSFSGIYI